MHTHLRTHTYTFGKVVSEQLLIYRVIDPMELQLCELQVTGSGRLSVDV